MCWSTEIAGENDTLLANAQAYNGHTYIQHIGRDVLWIERIFIWYPLFRMFIYFVHHCHACAFNMYSMHYDLSACCLWIRTCSFRLLSIFNAVRFSFSRVWLFVVDSSLFIYFHYSFQIRSSLYRFGCSIHSLCQYEYLLWLLSLSRWAPDMTLTFIPKRSHIHTKFCICANNFLELQNAFHIPHHHRRPPQNTPTPFTNFLSSIWNDTIYIDQSNKIKLDKSNGHAY